MDRMGNRIFYNDAMPDNFIDDAARSIAGVVGSSRQEPTS